MASVLLETLWTGGLGLGTVRSSLTELIGILRSAVEPDQLELDDGTLKTDDGPPSVPVTVRSTSLSRVGRSRRDGPVLDLELTVAVECRGPRQLDNIEKLLLAVERHSKYTTLPAGNANIGTSGANDAQARNPVQTALLGFLVRVPVSVRLDEPSGPPVLEPLIARTVIGRRISGQLLDIHNQGIPNARIRAHSSATAVVSDAAGRFEVLASADELQHFAVAVRGTEREVTATTSTLPVTIRWE